MSTQPVEVLGTGLVYRNPKPHVRSVHAYFPSVVTLPNGEMLAALCFAEAFEAVNMHVWLARSTDDGETWSLERRLTPDTPGRLTSDACRITAMPDGEVVAFVVRHDRTDHPDEGLTNVANMGFVPTELLLMRSRDGGRTWTDPETVEPPLVGPSFELCSPITPLRDGRWLLPTATWRGWDGDCPNGMRTIALVSRDRGATWPEWLPVFGKPDRPVLHFESKVVELPDGRLVGTSWGYDEGAAADLPNQYVVSEDGGLTWTPPLSTGLHGQTLTPFVLPDGQIFCVYRRIDRPGLWANLSCLDGVRWVNEAAEPLWGAGVTGLTAAGENMAQNFHVLRFGAPCVHRAPGGDVFVAFWCYEDCVSNIRWIRLRVPA